MKDKPRQSTSLMNSFSAGNKYVELHYNTVYSRPDSQQQIHQQALSYWVRIIEFQDHNYLTQNVLSDEWYRISISEYYELSFENEDDVNSFINKHES